MGGKCSRFTRGAVDCCHVQPVHFKTNSNSSVFLDANNVPPSDVPGDISKSAELMAMSRTVSASMATVASADVVGMQKQQATDEDDDGIYMALNPAFREMRETFAREETLLIALHAQDIAHLRESHWTEQAERVKLSAAVAELQEARARDDKERQLARANAARNHETAKHNSASASKAPPSKPADPSLQAKTAAGSASASTAVPVARLIEMQAAVARPANHVKEYLERLQLLPGGTISLAKVIETNKEYCMKNNYHLAGAGHRGNVSQLYRLLNEEIAELVLELREQPTISKAKAASEADGVLSYVLQFIWEFDLSRHFGEQSDKTGATAEASARRMIDLNTQSFPDLQAQAAREGLAAASDGSVYLDLGRLPLLGAKLAASVRLINGDFKKDKLTPEEHGARLANDIAAILLAVAEITAVLMLKMGGKCICGKPGPKKSYQT